MKLSKQLQEAVNEEANSVQEIINKVTKVFPNTRRRAELLESLYAIQDSPYGSVDEEDEMLLSINVQETEGELSEKLAEAAKTAKPVKTFTDKEDDMEARIFRNDQGGYNVTLVDLDSGNTLPTIFKFPKLSQAIAKAKKIVKQ